MKNRLIVLWLVCMLILTVLPAGLSAAADADADADQIFVTDMSITVGASTGEETAEAESEAAENPEDDSEDGSQAEAESDPEVEPSDYDPDWIITLNAYDIVLYLSENDYNILADGGIEDYAWSLQRLELTPEQALEILDNNAAMMEIAPIGDGEYADYILFFQNDGMYEGAEGKSLAELAEEGSPVAEQFLEDCRAWLLSEDTGDVISREENVKIGPFLWNIYTISYDDYNSIYFFTVQNGCCLVVKGIYDEEQFNETIHAAVETIFQNAEIIQEEESPAVTQMDGSVMFDLLFGPDPLELSDMIGLTSFDIIHYFPFGTPKETIRTALEKNHMIYESTGSGSNEFYVFYRMDLNEDWQCFYEFDENDSLISVTLAFIGDADSDELSRAFLRALDHMTEENGAFETADQADIDLIREDSNAFMQKLDKGESHITCRWQDAFGPEGGELYLTFIKLQGAPALYLTYFAKGYQY